MFDRGITFNEAVALTDCPAYSAKPYGRHIWFKVTRRRLRDLWFKSYWLLCTECDQMIKHYHP